MEVKISLVNLHFTFAFTFIHYAATRAINKIHSETETFSLEKHISFFKRSQVVVNRML